MALNIIEKYDTQFEYASILMNVFIIFQFFILWSNPQLDDVASLAAMVGLMIFEFVMVHSGVLMAVTPKKISLYVLIPFYGLFAFLFNLSVEDNIILIAYLMVVFNRMRFAFSDAPEFIRKRTILKSVIVIFAYFVLLVPLVLGAEYVPEWGLTQQFINLSGYKEIISGSGLFSEMPHIAIVFGFLYYIALTIIEAVFLTCNFKAKAI